mgnify:CR=1 FL=1
MKLWLFYANAGGGHRRPADAVKEELERKYGAQIEAKLVDAIGDNSPFSRIFLEKGYSFLIDFAPWLYRIIYEISKIKAIMVLENFAAILNQKNYFIKKLQVERPDKIVAFFYLAGPLIEAIRALKLNIPITFIITDPFTTHPFWFLYKNNKFIVLSEQVKAQALRAGINERNVVVFPPIIHRKFKLAPTSDRKREFCAKFNLDFDKKMILLIGGGYGLPKGKQALKILAESDIDAQYIVACGRNKLLQRNVEKYKKNHPEKKIITFSFVDFVEDMIAASDLVIGKAGASVMMETLLLKKPLVIINYIWGQEGGNVDFVVKNNLGFFEPKLSNLPFLVKEIFSGRKSIDEEKSNLLESGTEKIAEYIYTKTGN